MKFYVHNECNTNFNIIGILWELNPIGGNLFCIRLIWFTPVSMDPIPTDAHKKHTRTK